MAERPLGPVQASLAEAGSFEKMFRKFVRRVRDEGTLSELMARRAFVKPSQERRRRKRPAR